MKQGIDVAKWNGNIDWKQVKAAGIEFAILKVTRKDNAAEELFEKNYRGCAQNGIPVGVYRYVYAQNIKEAQKEANAIIAALNGKNITCHIWLDMEDPSIRVIGRQRLTEVIDAEAQILQAAGYTAGIYCSKDWYDHVLDARDLRERYQFWIARYGRNDGTWMEKYSPRDIAAAWQYTSKGRVNGVTGDVDRNVAFSDFEMAIPPALSAYHKGERVSFSSCYQSPADDITKAMLCSPYDKGTITEIILKSANAYQIDHGRCYINDGDIRGRAADAGETGETYYSVKKGDTLSRIAVLYNTTVNAILAQNKTIQDPDRIFIGQKIKVK